MLLQGTSATRRGTTYPSEFAGVPGNDKRKFSPPRPKPLNTDAILLAGLRSGEQHAYEEMVRRFGGRLLATARHYLRSEADACDALQDAFLCAFKSIGTFKGDSRLSTWLYRILVNTALMHLRAKRYCREADGGEINDSCRDSILRETGSTSASIRCPRTCCLKRQRQGRSSDDASTFCQIIVESS